MLQASYEPSRPPCAEQTPWSHAFCFQVGNSCKVALEDGIWGAVNSHGDFVRLPAWILIVTVYAVLPRTYDKNLKVHDLLLTTSIADTSSFYAFPCFCSRPVDIPRPQKKVLCIPNLFDIKTNMVGIQSYLREKMSHKFKA